MKSELTTQAANNGRCFETEKKSYRCQRQNHKVHVRLDWKTDAGAFAAAAVQELDKCSRRSGKNITAAEKERLAEDSEPAHTSHLSHLFPDQRFTFSSSSAVLTCTGQTGNHLWGAGGELRGDRWSRTTSAGDRRRGDCGLWCPACTPLT